MEYDPEHCAVFFKTRELYGELSNMRHGYPLEWEGRLVHSSEALYQAHKFRHGTEAFEIVLSQKNAMVSKMKAKKFRADIRYDWDSVKLDVMNYCVRLKYHQHQHDMDAVLDMTLDMPIVEKSRKDRLWGAVNDYRGHLVGENLLGHLWMIIRDERPDVAMPSDILHG